MRAIERIELEIPVPEELRDVLSRMWTADVEIDAERMVVRVASSSVRECT